MLCVARVKSGINYRSTVVLTLKQTARFVQTGVVLIRKKKNVWSQNSLSFTFRHPYRLESNEFCLHLRQGNYVFTNVSLSVCLFVSLSVDRITQKLLIKSLWKFYGMVGLDNIRFLVVFRIWIQKFFVRNFITAILTKASRRGIGNSPKMPKLMERYTVYDRALPYHILCDTRVLNLSQLHSVGDYESEGCHYCVLWFAFVVWTWNNNPTPSALSSFSFAPRFHFPSLFIFEH